jgi:hypothetical protein
LLGAQIDGQDHGPTVRPASNDVKWKDKISTDLLWDAFQQWMKINHPVFEGSYTKTGFCTLFYSVSGSAKAVMRVGQDRRIPIAEFADLNNHKNYRAAP